MAETIDRAEGVRTVLTCMLANNVTFGVLYGSFGALLASNEQAFGVGRATISFGMSATATTLGLSALVMGNLVQRLTPRRSIALGLIAATIGFAGLGLTTKFGFAIFCWALLGFGASLAAILGPVTLAAAQFPGRTGKVLGLINLPVLLFLGPWLVTEILPWLGRQGTYALLASLPLPVLALVWRLPAGVVATSAPEGVVADGPMASRPDFWLLSLTIGLIAGTGTAYAVHGIPYAQSRGIEPLLAALIMSAYSGAGIAGVLVFGWLADRLGAARSLMLSAAVQSLSWAAFVIFPPSGFLALSAVLGMATSPLVSLHGAAMAQLFGPSGVSRAMGYSYAIKLPFLFATAPLVGFAYVSMGDYRPAYVMVAGLLIVAAVLPMAGALMQRGKVRRSA